MFSLSAKRAFIASPLVAAFASLVLAGPERIDFPADYKTSFTQYWAGERMNGEQYSITYANDNAIAALAAGEPLGDGAQVVMEVYKLAQDEEGNAAPGALAAVAVMQNQTGWGEAYDEELRNGDWDFGVFTPAGELKGTDATACLECHQPYGDTSYMFTYEQLAAMMDE